MLTCIGVVIFGVPVVVLSVLMFCNRETAPSRLFTEGPQKRRHHRREQILIGVWVWALVSALTLFVYVLFVFETATARAELVEEPLDRIRIQLDAARPLRVDLNGQGQLDTRGHGLIFTRNGDGGALLLVQSRPGKAQYTPWLSWPKDKASQLRISVTTGKRQVLRIDGPQGQAQGLPPFVRVTTGG